MRIAFLGDIALVGQFSSVGNNIDYLCKLLEEYDYIVANLESPMTNKTTTIVPKSMHLRADEKSVEVLKRLKINAVTLANNHTYDYGRKGVEDTIRVLDAAGIKWYGIDGKTITETVKGERFTLSGFCCLSTNGTGYRKESGKGINTLTRNALEAQVKLDKENDAVSVVSAHYGIEHTNYPALEHIRLFERISSENTVIVHGHHPHQIQGIEEKNGSLIAYSLGNAIFDKTTSINKSFSLELNEENRKSFVLGAEIVGGKVRNYETNGFYISNEGIIPFEIIEELGKISDPLRGIADSVKYQEKRMEQYQAMINKKFGKHDMKWALSRLNYYSLGAKLGSIIRSRKFEMIRKDY
jgi:poly-gamma-glutamate synthesis protein (capsule biosynthesis protein)